MRFTRSPWQITRNTSIVRRWPVACIEVPAEHRALHFQARIRPLAECRPSHASPAHGQRLAHGSGAPLKVFGPDEATIYALSTAPGRAAIAVIRISGPACTAIYAALCPSKKLPVPRYAAVRSLYVPHSSSTINNLLDSNALVLYFPGPKTVTGEDVLELHVHGGPATVKAVLSAISQCATSSRRIRYAEPGEFTRRAFMNDRLSLTQVEALGDTLAATTEQQRRLSVRGTTNRLSERYEAWRKQLLLARGELEALIDFSEDQHFDESPTELTSSVAKQIKVLQHALEAHSRNAVRGELLRNGISISLLGAPNTGKSSLLNRIVGREAAIVSQEAGTTRDVVEVGLDLGGYLCRLGDTAGLRMAKEMGDGVHGKMLGAPIGHIEKEGMRRAKERAAESDVVIVVLSFEDAELTGEAALSFDPEVISTAQNLSEAKGNVIVVVNKMDRKPANVTDSQVVDFVGQQLHCVPSTAVHCTSCRDADTSTLDPFPDQSDQGGIQSFLTGLIDKFHELTRPVGRDDATSDSDTEKDPSIWEESLGATERHRLLLEECQQYLADFLSEVNTGLTSGGEEEAEIDIVLAAESLRGAASSLAKITGKGDAGDVEEVLGVVFEKFCVGK